MDESERLRLAEAVRAACAQAALSAYEAARFDGLCEEGAIEVAVDAVRDLDLRPLVARVSQGGGD